MGYPCPSFVSGLLGGPILRASMRFYRDAQGFVGIYGRNSWNRLLAYRVHSVMKIIKNPTEYYYS